jgi:hypothetical protein
MMQARDAAGCWHAACDLRVGVFSTARNRGVERARTRGRRRVLMIIGRVTMRIVLYCVV